MGKSQRDKGLRREREVVNHWLALGIKSARVPLSGASGGDYAGDVDLYAFGEEEAPLIGEVKARGNGGGFKTIAKWLGLNDFLVLHEDNKPRLYVLPEHVLQKLMGIIYLTPLTLAGELSTFTVMGASPFRGRDTKMINHPNRSTLYTVLRPSGEPEARGCTTPQAAEIALTYDSAEFDIRRGRDENDVGDESQWELWSKSLNGKWMRTSSVKPIYAVSADAAWPLIAREVLSVCGQWRNSCSVMTDADYDAMVVEANG